MQFKDYYQTLGVEPGAGESELKSAYRRLARKYHPDVSKEADAEARFKAVNEAYEALRDPEKRKAYDQLRARGYRPGDEMGPAPGGFGHAGAEGFDFEEVFAGGGAGGGFSDFFEEMFGRRRAQTGGHAPPRGDTRARLSVALETVYAGGSVRISVRGRTLEVRVPRGVRPGQVIRLKGQGAGDGAMRGDLLLEVEYAAHPQFEVDGHNVIHLLQVAPWEAALGAVVSVPTLGGAVELRIPPDSEAGRKLRLRGRGLPLPREAGAGDQLVELEITAPRAVEDSQRQAYRDLQAAFGDSWRRS